MSRTRITRRRFLGAAATSMASFTTVPRHVLSGSGHAPPSETITGALIGRGNRGEGAWKAMKIKDIRRLAVCDVDTAHLGGGVDNKTFYTDFRRLMDRTDIDVVCIATPPHWHALISIAAAESGKDIFCEKPMTKFIAEGRAVVEACRRNGRVFQIGTFGRFDRRGNKDAVECHKIVRHGLVKDLEGVVVRAGVPMRLGHTHLGEEPVPATLDYDLWLGPAPYKPYNKERVHYKNRFYWDYEGGDLANFGAHRVDPFQWTFAKDGTSPVEVEPCGQWPQHPDAVGPWGWVELTYADGLKFVLETKEWGEPYDRAVRRGGLGAMDLDEGGRRRLAELPDPERLLGFEEAIRSRKDAGGNAEVSHRASTVLHLANIAIRMGRKIRYDPVREEIIGDEEANRFVNIPMRAPWHL